MNIGEEINIKIASLKKDRTRFMNNVSRCNREIMGNKLGEGSFLGTWKSALYNCERELAKYVYLQRRRSMLAETRRQVRAEEDAIFGASES